MTCRDVSDKMFQAFGGKNRLDLKFAVPKKVLVKENSRKDEIFERVTTITIMEFQQGFCTLDINYFSDKGNECSFSTGLSNYEGIEILD